MSRRLPLPAAPPPPSPVCNGKHGLQRGARLGRLAVGLHALGRRQHGRKPGEGDHDRVHHLVHLPREGSGGDTAGRRVRRARRGRARTRARARGEEAGRERWAPGRAASHEHSCNNESYLAIIQHAGPAQALARPCCPHPPGGRPPCGPPAAGSRARAAPRRRLTRCPAPPTPPPGWGPTPAQTCRAPAPRWLRAGPAGQGRGEG